jgi:hypothetical protein
MVSVKVQGSPVGARRWSKRVSGFAMMTAVKARQHGEKYKTQMITWHV